MLVLFCSTDLELRVLKWHFWFFVNESLKEPSPLLTEADVTNSLIHSLNWLRCQMRLSIGSENKLVRLKKAGVCIQNHHHHLLVIVWCYSSPISIQLLLEKICQVNPCHHVHIMDRGWGWSWERDFCEGPLWAHETDFQLMVSIASKPMPQMDASLCVDVFCNTY